jgi:hypothetical protein
MAEHTGIVVPAPDTIPDPYPAPPGQGDEPDDAGDHVQRGDAADHVQRAAAADAAKEA